MYTFKIKFAATAAIAALASSCITNDLPYPWVQPTVTSFEVAKTTSQGNPLLGSPTEIDSASRTVTVHLSEWADINNVSIEGYTLSEGSTLISPTAIPSALDLSEPYTVTLGLYERTFDWTISATQEIERYFTVRSQVSSSVIDVENHTVLAHVPMSQSLSAVHVNTIKLAGPSATMTPDLTDQTVDFNTPVKIEITEFGKTTEWTVTVKQTQVSVDISRVDPWTSVAWVYASVEAGKQSSIQYREAGQEDWIVAPADWLTVEGGSITACLRNLQPQTAYTVRAVTGSETSAEVDFTTEENIQLPNSDFTQWWKNGKVWNPWSENGESFWDTGNRGATTIGQSNTVPLENPASATGYEGAVLETKFVGVSILGKLAAGNLFAGSYVRTDGTNGILAFGRPFTHRPTAIKARIKYATAPITHVSKTNPDFQYMMGQPDTCIVWCALTDSPEPFEIRTKPSERNLFQPDLPEVIAYGEVTSGNSIEQFTDIIIKLRYVATDRVPTHILLTASASKYGDYFTGANGAVLTIDSYELLYDFVE